MDEQTILREQFKKMPQNLQELVLSNDLSEKFFNISKKHNLHHDQAGALETETLLVIMGLDSAADYPKNLKQALVNIPEEKLENIMLDVESLIIAPIRDSLISFIQSEAEETKAGEEAPVPRPEVPSNLPIEKTPDQVTSNFEQKFSQNVKSEHKETHLEEHPKEKTQPFSEDPYREPIE